MTRDDRQKDYLATFELIRAVIPSGDQAPAIGIIAHTGKPLSGERASGRALLNLLAASYLKIFALEEFVAGLTPGSRL